MALARSSVTEPKPLLPFAGPAVGPIPSSGRQPYRPVRRPSAARQGARLTPQFHALREALEAGRAHVTDRTVAEDPELVAVFDLAGSVDRFLKAAALIEGLDFLSELQDDLVEPDDDFFYDEDGEVSEDRVPQSLYMVMTNAQAVTELVRLFQRWQADPSITFERGLNPLKNVFGLLRTIRRWGPQDRIRETGLLEQWREDIEVVRSQGAARVEIELWYRSNPGTRAEAARTVRSAVNAAGGVAVAETDREQIAYHAILADIPYDQVDAVLADGPEAIDLLKTESVMLVTPSRPMAVFSPEPVSVGRSEWDENLPIKPPRVALLDGLPLANHSVLEGRLVIDDPDGLAARYSTSQRCHGTGMASLIAHGDLSEGGRASDSAIYVRPILEPHEHFPRTEVTPRDELLVDVLMRAFRRMFEGDGDHPPHAPSVRVVNLAIGDPARAFTRRVSPLARLLDWLAYEYNIVIVVSGGNHTQGPIVNTAHLADPESLQRTTVQSLYERARQRRLLSPAEAINALTVGALHSDATVIDIPDTVIDVIPDGLPASYSPVGFGFRRSVKPEIHLPGGRQLFQRPPPNAPTDASITPAHTLEQGPGIMVAAPGRGAELEARTYTTGTSNATALATRALDHILSTLESIESDEPGLRFPDPQYHPVLAKTLLVHAARWGALDQRLRETLGLSGQRARRQLTQLLGYGAVDGARVATAERVRAVLVGASSIEEGHRHTYRYPLPSGLNATTEWRRLTITLGWISPVNMRSQRYRMARLRFSPPRDELAVALVDADHNAVVKGTVQHQVLEGASAVAFAEGDSLSIEIDCRADAGRLERPVRYAIAASLEVAPTMQIDLHEQVRTAQRVLIQQLRGQVQTRS